MDDKIFVFYVSHPWDFNTNKYGTFINEYSFIDREMSFRELSTRRIRDISEYALWMLSCVSEEYYIKAVEVFDENRRGKCLKHKILFTTEDIGILSTDGITIYIETLRDMLYD